MNEELKSVLKDYRDYSIKLLEVLEKEEYDEIQNLLDKRQRIIDNIGNLEYLKEDFQTITKELNLMPIQQKLTLLLKKNMDTTKRKMDEFYQRKDASASYNKKFSVDSIFFNKKI